MWVRLKVIRFRMLVLTPIAQIPNSTIGVQVHPTGAASGDLGELRKAEQLLWRISTGPSIK